MGCCFSSPSLNEPHKPTFGDTPLDTHHFDEPTEEFYPEEKPVETAPNDLPSEIIDQQSSIQKSNTNNSPKIKQTQVQRPIELPTKTENVIAGLDQTENVVDGPNQTENVIDGPNQTENDVISKQSSKSSPPIYIAPISHQHIPTGATEQVAKNAKVEKTVEDIKEERKDSKIDDSNTTAADYARFKQLLFQGITLQKHNMNGKQHQRMLYIDMHETFIGWKVPIARRTSITMTFKKQNITVDISEIVEIRAGTDPDPNFPGQLGTETLRMSTDRNTLKRCFSIIWAKRSLDFECSSIGLNEALVNGFRKLIHVRNNIPYVEYRSALS